MMAARRTQSSLIGRLPEVRGRYRENVALDRVTWFRVGGPAEVLFKPADADDLAHFLKHKPADIPVTIIGVGSNLLVRDGGIDGVVIRMGGGFADIAVEGSAVRGGAAALDLNIARVAAEAGLAGLEFLSGVPGTLGGALRMNAGAYGAEIKDVLQSLAAIDGEGNIHEVGADECGFSYRHCGLPEDWIFVSATLKGTPGDKAEIRARMEEIAAAREASQPIRTRTGGSTFANPEGDKAWRLIDDAGCRGLKLGGAMVSEQHCNFLINTGDATAADIEALGEEVRRRVFETSGVRLRWEIRRVGKHGGGHGTGPAAVPGGEGAI